MATREIVKRPAVLRPVPRGRIAAAADPTRVVDRPAPQPEPLWRWLSPIGVVVLLSGMFMIKAVADYDVYWHLANGRLMVETGLFPDPDRFSWSMPGGAYTAYSAQLDRLFYGLWQFGGEKALALFAVVGFGLSLLPYAMLVGRLRLRLEVEALALIPVVIAVYPYRGTRPHIVAFVLCGLIVLLLDRPFGARKALAVGAALGLWAHLHGTFAVGFAVVGAAVVAWMLARDRRSTVAALAALGIGVGASLLTPYGARLWLLPFTTVSHPLLPLVNADWSGLRPFNPGYAAMGLLLVAAAAVGIWRATEARALAALGLVLPVIQIARLTPFAAPLVGWATLARLAESYPRLRVDPASPRYAVMTSRGAAAIAWTLLAVGTVAVGLRAPATLEAAVSQPVPAAAVERLLACGEPAPVWNDYNWGGYLIWRGEGRFPVGMDGRAETLYADTVFDDYLRVSMLQRGWQAIVAGSPARYALADPEVGEAIASLPGWRRVHADEVAVVAARTDAPWGCPVAG